MDKYKITTPKNDIITMFGYGGFELNHNDLPNDLWETPNKINAIVQKLLSLTFLKSENYLIETHYLNPLLTPDDTLYGFSLENMFTNQSICTITMDNQLMPTNKLVFKYKRIAATNRKEDEFKNIKVYIDIAKISK